MIRERVGKSFYLRSSVETNLARNCFATRGKWPGAQSTLIAPGTRVAGTYMWFMREKKSWLGRGF